jgi:hypothetical protein
MSFFGVLSMGWQCLPFSRVGCALGQHQQSGDPDLTVAFCVACAVGSELTWSLGVGRPWVGPERHPLASLPLFPHTQHITFCISRSYFVLSSRTSVVTCWWSWVYIKQGESSVSGCEDGGRSGPRCVCAHVRRGSLNDMTAWI